MIKEVLGIVLGLSMAAPPGPINAMIANESLVSKFHGTAVGLGAMTADLIFFIITFTIRNIIPREIIYPLYVAGGILMLYLSFSIFKSKMTSKSRKGNYISGLLIGLSNPYQLSWWLTAGLFMIQEFSLLIAPFFFTGILIWVICFPFIINKIGNKYGRYVKIFSIATLAGFGVYMLFLGLRALL